ncbi:hypothetical protein ACN47E_010182 [Coniothyrium glycines]
MSWIPVDFSSVRYSSIEGTHYFYDVAFPSTIQFVVSSKWESFNLNFVKDNALDPEIRLLAEEAEGRLVQDTRFGPQQKLPSSALPNSQPSHMKSHAQIQAHDRVHQPFATVATAPVDPTLPEQPLTPSSVQSSSIPKVNPELQPSGDAGTTKPSTQGTLYESPYGIQPHPGQSQAQAAPQTAIPSTSTTQFTFTFPPPGNITLHNLPPKAPLPSVPPQAPSLQPSAPQQVTLSRTRETKILLSLDGDGVRGLSSLLVIESLVNAICVKVNQRLDPHQIFDLTGGSSLGGVLAIMLCRLQMQPRHAREAFKKISKQAYRNKRNFFAPINSHTSLPTMDDSTLEGEIKAVIKEELGTTDDMLLDGREDAGEVFVVTTHIETGSNKAALIRSYTTRRITGPEIDTNMSIWQAMKATAVAPRYIARPTGITNRYVVEHGLVDYGKAKNNPVRDLLYECRKLFRYTNDMMVIVSIGTGVGMDMENEMAEMLTSVEDRQAEARATGEKFEQEFRPLMERNWMKYFRFNVTGLEDVSLEEWAHEDLIKEKTSAYLAQPDVGHMFYACVDAITTLLLGPPGW